MVSTLRPVTAVMCPSTQRLVAVEGCKDCEFLIEARTPWRHFAVKCRVGGQSEGAYP